MVVGRLFQDHKIIAPMRRKLKYSSLGLWSCRCGWTNTRTDLTCQRCGTEAANGTAYAA